MAQITLEGPDEDHKPFNTRDVSKQDGWGPKRIIAALNTMFAEIYAALGTIPVVDPTAPVMLPPYTVATLPDAVEAGMIYVSDGAAGSPIMAFSDGTDWLRCDTGAAVAGA